MRSLQRQKDLIAGQYPLKHSSPLNLNFIYVKRVIHKNYSSQKILPVTSLEILYTTFVTISKINTTCCDGSQQNYEQNRS